MFCKSCGTENLASANYCINDGTLLRPSNHTYRLKEKKSSYCANCGAKSGSNYMYCIECGCSTNQYTAEKTLATKLSNPKELGGFNKGASINLPKLNLAFFKSVLIPSIIAIVIVFALSFSIMKQSEKIYNSMLGDSLKQFDVADMLQEISSDEDLDLPKMDSLYGISDIVMTANLQNPVITIDANIFSKVSAEVEAKNGFLFYLLIPFLALFVAGIVAGRRNGTNHLSGHLSDAVGIAVIYAVFMAIFSLFAGFSLELGGKGLDMSFSMDTDYSFFKTLLMTFIFGFIFSGFGSLFSTNYRKVTGQLSEWMPSGEAIHQAIAIPIRGILLFSIGLIIYIPSKIDALKEEMGFFNTPLEKLIDDSMVLISSLSVQLAGYLWNLLHFASLTLFYSEGVKETGSLSYGIFSGFDATGEAEGTDLLFLEGILSASNVDVYLKLAMLIPIGLFIWAGFKIAQKPNLIKNLVVFSIVYAVIMCGLASFSDIGFSLTANESHDLNKMELGFGFGAAGTFIKSLLFSFVFAYLGSWIHKFRANA